MKNQFSHHPPARAFPRRVAVGHTVGGGGIYLWQCIKADRATLVKLALLSIVIPPMLVLLIAYMVENLKPETKL
jgi:hypothetical protein